MTAKFFMNVSLLTILMFLAGFDTANAATTLVEFDTPYMIAEENDGAISGHYGMSLPAAGGIRGAVSCDFFFSSLEKRPGSKNINITTFHTESTFSSRSIDEDLPGLLKIDRDGWTIQLEEVPGGCLTAAGGGFYKDAAVANAVTKRTPIIGILTVKNRTFFYDRVGRDFVKRKGFLVPGNVVIAFSQSGNFYLVRFKNADMDQDFAGWIKISDTGNPFPYSSR